MSEDEAKTKWCPFVRVKTEDRRGYASVNRQSDGARSQGTACIGSACMAWRKTEENEYRVTGYCGLAGRP